MGRREISNYTRNLRDGEQNLMGSRLPLILVQGFLRPHRFLVQESTVYLHSRIHFSLFSFSWLVHLLAASLGAEESSPTLLSLTSNEYVHRSPMLTTSLRGGCILPDSHARLSVGTWITCSCSQAAVASGQRKRKKRIKKFSLERKQQAFPRNSSDPNPARADSSGGIINRNHTLSAIIKINQILEEILRREKQSLWSSSVFRSIGKNNYQICGLQTFIFCKTN